ncbi:MAG: 5'-nucleotidase C-terminal domain-containing protein, partial [Ignavibacteria bacterium]|nr:5'-nucleotidase C-terminal domain-containing protein [Ignavibacteria bacterium]
SGEDTLQALVNTGRIASRTVLSVSGEQVGIIGATTPDLPLISSPRNVIVDPDVAGIVQMEIDALEASGVNKIILISHLQSITEELNLATQLSGVDIIIAGGGAELLANPGNLLTPGDSSQIFGPYPLIATDADSNDVPVVVTNGDYRYVGRLSVEFDANGDIVSIDTNSGPVRVAGGTNPDSVTPNPDVQTMVVDPVEQAIAALAANVVGTSQVVLDGLRTSVRTEETNLGNLIADALLWQGQELAGVFGVDTPKVALQNGGGIRNNSEIPAGDITELTTFDILPFTNFVTIIPAIPPAQFKEILENAVSRVKTVRGRFAQIGGFVMTWDPSGTAQVLDANGNPTTAGTRIVLVTLDDGTPIVVNGTVVAGAPDLHISTIDFLARGGDQYPYRGAAFTSVGVTYQQALANYITQLPNSLIAAADYPEGGEGRITEFPHPFVLLAEDLVFVDELDASEGDIHSNNKVLFGRAHAGDPSTHTGNLSAVNDVEIRKNNTIIGDVTAGGTVILKGNATVTGTVTENTMVDAVPLPTLSFTAGGDDIRVTSGESLTLAPGSYGNVFVRKGVLSVSSGEYFMVTLKQGKRARLDVDVTNGPVTINVVDELKFGKSMQVTIKPSGESGTTQLRFNLLGSNRVPLPKRARVLGTIIAPNAKVRVRQHVAFKGAICAKNITVDDDATVLHHSSTMPLPTAPLLLANLGDNMQSTNLPTVYELSQNYPNPFNPTTVIEYALPEESHVKLEVYSILGQRVATLVDETRSAGYYAERFDAIGLASGLYIYRMQAGNVVETRKLMLLK